MASTPMATSAPVETTPAVNPPVLSRTACSGNPVVLGVCEGDDVWLIVDESDALCDADTLCDGDCDGDTDWERLWLGDSVTLGVMVTLGVRETLGVRVWLGDRVCDCVRVTVCDVVAFCVRERVPDCVRLGVNVILRVPLGVDDCDALSLQASCSAESCTARNGSSGVHVEPSSSLIKLPVVQADPLASGPAPASARSAMLELALADTTRANALLSVLPRAVEPKRRLDSGRVT
jgi:hypothetical protein